MKALGELCGAAPEEIDKLLLVEGFSVDAKPRFTGQVNLLSSIHTVLRRMTEAGEIEKTDDGKFRLFRG